jgi:hypothetical protein
MPKNMRSLEVSSGGFSCACVVGIVEDSEAVDAAVEAGEFSKDPDDAEAMVIEVQ